MQIEELLKDPNFMGDLTNPIIRRRAAEAYIAARPTGRKSAKAAANSALGVSSHRRRLARAKAANELIFTAASYDCHGRNPAPYVLRRETVAKHIRAWRTKYPELVRDRAWVLNSIANLLWNSASD